MYIFYYDYEISSTICVGFVVEIDQCTSNLSESILTCKNNRKIRVINDDTDCLFLSEAVEQNS